MSTAALEFEAFPEQLLHVHLVVGEHEHEIGQAQGDEG